MTPEQSRGQLKRLNGVELYLELHGTGEPVLLLHGFSGSSQDWEVVANDWSRDFQLIVPDLRGHGRSSVLSTPFRHADSHGPDCHVARGQRENRVAIVGVGSGPRH
jgi:pimeloyl-ACP methyl ester carboxylesterase